MVMNWRNALGSVSLAICAAAATATIVNNSVKIDASSSSPQILPLSKLPKRIDDTQNDAPKPHNTQVDSKRLKETIKRARNNCLQIKEQFGLPGISVAVSVNGRVVWKEGFGFADIENGVKMKPESVMRIASISKSMTMAMMAQLMEQGKIDIDAPIQKYLPNYPQKTFNGENVTITTRHLLSHLSGIRHYTKKAELDKQKEEGTTDNEFSEFFMKTKCDTVEKALELFKDDELIYEPGKKYFYTTHGWTVVSAIIEKLTETPFQNYCRKMFEIWGLKHTFLDEHEPIIYNRASHYSKDKKGKLINSPWVDNSCKWAGGGFLSNVLDLLQFSHIMLISQQQPIMNCSSSGTETGLMTNKAFLKRETIDEIWTGNNTTATPNVDNLYGLGFGIGEPFLKCLYCKERRMKTVGHTGGAVGASSVLHMQFPPPQSSNEKGEKAQVDQIDVQVKGIVVAMITNLIDVGLSKTAKEIAEDFEWMV